MQLALFAYPLLVIFSFDLYESLIVAYPLVLLYQGMMLFPVSVPLYFGFCP